MVATVSAGIDASLRILIGGLCPGGRLVRHYPEVGPVDEWPVLRLRHPPEGGRLESVGAVITVTIGMCRTACVDGLSGRPLRSGAACAGRQERAKCRVRPWSGWAGSRPWSPEPWHGRCLQRPGMTGFGMSSSAFRPCAPRDAGTRCGPVCPFCAAAACVVVPWQKRQASYRGPGGGREDLQSAVAQVRQRASMSGHLMLGKPMAAMA